MYKVENSSTCFVVMTSEAQKIEKVTIKNVLNKTVLIRKLEP